MSAQGALTGTKVIDLSRLLPGPYCSMILADHGADVIAIEDRRFQDDGLFMHPVYRNKRHMCLDLKSAAGRSIFLQLVSDADVLLEGFRPGVVQRLGVDYESVRAVNPRIVYCSISGYGQNGPCRNLAGHDANYLSRAGVLELIGERDHPPSIPGVQIADIAGGGMNAAIGILLALLARAKSGRGQYIDISMTDGMVAMLPAVFFVQNLTGRTPERSAGFLSHRYACYNTYTTADGRHLSIAAVENRFWKNLCEVLEAPEYAALQYDEERRQEIVDFMRQCFRQKTLRQWKELLADRDVCWAPVQRLEEVVADPLFRRREMIIPADEPGPGKDATIGIPVKLSDTPGSLRSAPTGFGKDTVEILRELGYSTAAIAELRNKHII